MNGFVHAAGQTSQNSDITPVQIPASPAVTTESPPASAPATNTMQHAGSFIAQLPRTIPWWGWALAGLGLGYVIGSRR